MLNISSDELEEFKKIVTRFEKGDFEDVLSFNLNQLLDKNYLPKKISQNEFLIEGDLGNNQRKRIVLKDDFIDLEQDLHQITAQIDETENMVNSCEDRVVTECYGGATRITSTQATGRMRNAVGPSLVDVNSTVEHVFNVDGTLSSYSYENEKSNTRKSLLINNGKIEIKNNEQHYEFDMPDEVLYNKENVKHVPVNIDTLVTYLQSKNNNVMS